MMTNRDVNGCRRRAASASRRAYAAVDHGDTAKAHRYIVIAGDAMERAVQLADDADDILTLASTFTRRAAIADELGFGEEAVSAARKAVDLWGQFDTTRGDPDAVVFTMESAASPLAMLNHATGSVVLHSEGEHPNARVHFIKWHAAAKQNLAHFMAAHRPPGDGGEIRHLGSTSVVTLRELERAGASVTAVEINAAAAKYDQTLTILVERARDTIERHRRNPGASNDRADLAQAVADAGEEGIQALRDLVDTDPQFHPDLNRAMKLEKQQRRFDPEKAAKTERKRIAALIEQAEETHAKATEHSRAGRLVHAAEAAQDALDIYRQLAAGNRWFRRMVAATLLTLGRVNERTGNIRAAVAAVREAAVIFESVYRNDDHRFLAEVRLARKGLRHLRLVRLGLAPKHH